MKNFILILLILLSGDSGGNAQPNKKELDTIIKRPETNEIIVDTSMYNKPDPGNQKLKAAALEVKIIKLEANQVKNEAVELKETLQNSPKTVREVKKEIKREERQKEKEERDKNKS